MKLLLSTNNPHKLEEFRRIFPDMTILSMKDLSISLEVEETGSTFAQNARLKAMALYEKTKLPTIADDSGLAVEALNGAPGVYSARYSGEHATDAQNCEKLLRELKDIPTEQRGAKFVCAIHLVVSAQEEYAVCGECVGSIAFSLQGENGFGYDPLFLVGTKSFAQMSAKEKDAISHRGKAIQALLPIIQKLKSS